MTAVGHPAFSEGPEGAMVRIEVQPKAGRDEVMDLRPGALRVRLKAPPVEGEANRALVKFLSRRVGAPQKDVEIVAGHRSRRKTVRFRGLGIQEVIERLSPAADR